MDYTENAKTILALNHQFVKQGIDIMCDENPAYIAIKGMGGLLARESSHARAYRYDRI